MITTAGKAWLAQYITKGNAEDLLYIGVGFGATLETIGDTSLVSEQYRSSGNVSRVGNIITLALVVPPGIATGNIVEAGLFSNLTGPTLYDRITFPVKQKNVGDALVISWIENIG